MAEGDNTTTIRIHISTWRRLNSLKTKPNDTLENVILSLLDYKYGRRS